MEYEKFQSKWQTEKEPNLFCDKPKTQRQFFYKKYWEYFKKNIYFTEKFNVLEVGCGRGTISQYLKSFGVQDVTLVDKDPGALKISQQNLPLSRFARADATDLSFAGSGEYDTVFSMGVIEHIPDYLKFYSEAHRVLRTGGTFVALIIPNKRWPQCLNIFGTNKYYRNDGVDYIEHLHVNGFKLERVDWVNPYPVLTPVPQWMERPITFLYRQIDRILSFTNKEKLCQGFFLIATKR